ncbi:MAG: hypothetical protein PF589_12285 [Gammaproteobacteria bacterium]|jgi:hypothetical protein|nr:hypothetical protein [Gammaproteobacteria bacterium]
MKLIADGERSRAKVGFGKKLLRIVKMLGVPAKSSMLDGFFFKAKSISGMDSVMIKAPMGAIVSCSKLSGIKISMAENWTNQFMPSTDFYSAAVDTTGVSVSFWRSGAAGNEISEHSQISSPYGYPYVSPDIDNPRPNPDYFDGLLGTSLNTPSSPVLTPAFNGEAFFISSSMVADTASEVYGHSCHGKAELLLNFFTQSGKQDTRYAVLSQSAEQTPSFVNGFYNFEAKKMRYTLNTIFNLPPGEPGATGPTFSKRAIIASEGLTEFSGELSLGQYWKMSTTGYEYDLLKISRVFSGIPEPALATLRGYENLLPGQMYSDGQYAFSSPATKDAILFIHIQAGGWYLLDGCSGSESLCNEYENFFTFFNCDDDTVAPTYITSSQIEGLALYFIYHDQTTVSDFQTERSVRQMLPYPNRSCDIPFDSCMFHDHDGIIYSWSREHGFIKFTPNGVYLCDESGSSYVEATPAVSPAVVPTFTFTPYDFVVVSVPAVVLNTEGLRPLVTYSGQDSDTGDHIYMCVCESVEEGGLNRKVENIFRGSPFSLWAEIPMPGPDYTLLKTRIINATSTSINVLGVVKSIVNEIVVFNLAFLGFKDASESNQWVLLGSIDTVDDGTAMEWDMCLFGDGPFVGAMNNYPSLPASTPQHPISPYNMYLANP